MLFIKKICFIFYGNTPNIFGKTSSGIENLGIESEIATFFNKHGYEVEFDYDPNAACVVIPKSISIGYSHFPNSLAIDDHLFENEDYAEILKEIQNSIG